MAATTWSDAPYIDKQEWLLADGSIVVSPDFETTSSGRRVRIKGTSVSAGNRQIQDLIHQAIDEVAKQRNTTRWVRIWPEATDRNWKASQASVQHDIFDQAASFHLNNTTVEHSSVSGSTTLLWDFKAKGLPLTATVFVILGHSHQRTTVSTKVMWQSTNPADFVDESTPSLLRYVDGTYNFGSLHRHGPEYQALGTLMQGVLEDLGSSLKSRQNQIRQSVIDLAERAKAVNEIDHLMLPDLRDPSKPVLMRYDLVTTNYNASVHQELMDVVQTAPLLQKIETAYTDMINAMSSLGVVFVEKPGSNAFTELAGGETKHLVAKVAAVEDETQTGSNGVDHHHTVEIDFTTGSVIVNCSIKLGGGNSEALAAWESALFMESLKGQKDMLLEYARAYKEPKEQARIKRIIEQRSLSDGQ